MGQNMMASARTAIPVLTGLLRLAVFSCAVIPLMVIIFSFATLEDDFNGGGVEQTTCTDSDVERDLDFPGFVALLFATFCRIIQVLSVTFLMFEMIITTLRPLNWPVPNDQQFLAYISVPWRAAISTLMIVTATISSKSYDRFLSATRIDKAIEATSALIGGARFPIGCDVEIDVDDDEIFYNGPGTSSTWVLEMFFFSKAFLLAVGCVGLVCSLIYKLPGKDSESLRMQRIAMMLWPLTSGAFQIYFLQERWNQVGTDSLDNRDTADWYYDGAYYVSHTAQLVLDLVVLFALVMAMVRSKQVHLATVAIGAFALLLSYAEFRAYALVELGCEDSDDITLGVSIMMICLLALPLVVYFLGGCCGQGPMEGFLKELRGFWKIGIDSIFTSSGRRRVYGLIHCISTASGVAALVFVFLSMGSPMVSLNFDVGPEFSKLYESVEDIETQVKALQGKLKDAADSLNPCSSLPEINPGDTMQSFLAQSRYSSNPTTQMGIGNYTDVTQEPGGVNALFQLCQIQNPRNATCQDVVDKLASQETTQRFDNAKSIPRQSRGDTCPLEVFPESSADPDFAIDQQCEDIMCGVFFGSMVALTAASFVPFAGSAAVAAKIAARIARNVVKLGKLLFKTYKTVRKHRGKISKAVAVLKRVASNVGTTALYASNGMLLMLAPTLLVGIFAIFIGFWKRGAANDATATGAFTIIAAILASINGALFIATYFFVDFADEMFDKAPAGLVQIDVKEEGGMRFLRAALASACLCATYWAVATMSETVRLSLLWIFTCGKRGSRHGAGKGVYTGSKPLSTESGVHNKNPVLVTNARHGPFGGWLLALIVCLPGIALVHRAFEKEQRAVTFGLWNNDDANNVMDALQSSGAMGKSTDFLNDDVSSLGCGPVGIAGQAIASAIFDQIKTDLPLFNEAFASLRAAAGDFIGAISSIDFDNPFSALNISYDWSPAEFLLMFSFPLLGFALVGIGAIVALIFPERRQLLGFLKSALLTLSITGIEVSLAIIGVASTFDQILVPFFELRVEWGGAATASLLTCTLGLFAAFSLHLNDLVAIGDEVGAPDHDHDGEAVDSNGVVWTAPEHI